VILDRFKIGRYVVTSRNLPGALSGRSAGGDIRLEERPNGLGNDRARMLFYIPAFRMFFLDSCLA
jgi:hypothetical protein